MGINNVQFIVGKALLLYKKLNLTSFTVVIACGRYFAMSSGLAYNYFNH